MLGTVRTPRRNEQTQRDFHTRVFNPQRWQIITADRMDVGMIDIGDRPNEVYLARIEILPGYQGRGIGTVLIEGLMNASKENGQDVVLDVLAVNHRARALYRRLGMTDTETHGDGNIKVRMRYAG